MVDCHRQNLLSEGLGDVRRSDQMLYLVILPVVDTCSTPIWPLNRRRAYSRQGYPSLVEPAIEALPCSAS